MATENWNVIKFYTIFARKGMRNWCQTPWVLVGIFKLKEKQKWESLVSSAYPICTVLYIYFAELWAGLCSFELNMGGPYTLHINIYLIFNFISDWEEGKLKESEKNIRNTHATVKQNNIYTVKKSQRIRGFLLSLILLYTLKGLGHMTKFLQE